MLPDGDDSGRKWAGSLGGWSWDSRRGSISSSQNLSIPTVAAGRASINKIELEFKATKHGPFRGAESKFLAVQC